MIGEIQKLIDNYSSWLNDKTSLKELSSNWVEITTPYLDRHNDYIQIYVKLDKRGEIVLTDDGYTIRDLKLSGCELNTDKRRKLFEQTINGFGVKSIDDCLLVKSNKSNFALKKHNLVQTILAVNDLFYLNTTFVTSLFLEDVIKWFDINEVRYSPRVNFTGRSGYNHFFNFLIPKSKQKPERLVQAFNKPTKSQAESFIFAWVDTKEMREPYSLSYAMLNDQEEPPAPSVMEALSSYDISPILWSNRKNYIEELVA